MCYARCCNDETTQQSQAMFWRVTLCAMHAVAMMRQHNKAGSVLEKSLYVLCTLLQ